MTSRNITYLAHTLAVVCSCSVESAQQYLNEVNDDVALRSHVLEKVTSSRFRHLSDDACLFGRRIGWYAIVRLMRPRVVIETGVDKGHGAVLICAALMRNQKEGFSGRYYGTDINPNAGFLFTEPYSRFGKILYGDSLESLRGVVDRIDLFINDSDHSSDYERREYEVIQPKLSPAAIILGDNSHSNAALADFSRAHGRRFLFFREEPRDHWYPGAGIGISFPFTPGLPLDIDRAERSLKS